MVDLCLPQAIQGNLFRLDSFSYGLLIVTSMPDFSCGIVFVFVAISWRIKLYDYQFRLLVGQFHLSQLMRFWHFLSSVN